MNTPEVQKTDAECILDLPSVADIGYAETLCQQLTQICQGNNHHVIIHAGNVERITTPAVQLLLSTDKFLRSEGGNLKVKSPSEVFSNVLQDLGLGSQLKEWSGA